jgi:hypothetical protein
MDRAEINVHLRAATAAGKDSACGTKIQHSTLDGAQSHADSLNRRPEVLPRSEPYPCPWCSPSPNLGRFYWHVGREMTEEERVKYGS